MGVLPLMKGVMRLNIIQAVCILPGTGNMTAGGVSNDDVIGDRCCQSANEKPSMGGLYGSECAILGIFGELGKIAV